MSLRPCLLRRSLTSTWGEFSLSAKRTGRPQADLTSAFGNLLPLFLSSPRRSVERYLPFIFNGGLGIMRLAIFGLLGCVDLHGMNGLKNVLSAMLVLISAAAFAVAGIIGWQEAALIAAACAAGGYAGACAARRIGRTDLLREAIAAVGLVMTIIFFARWVSPPEEASSIRSRDRWRMSCVSAIRPQIESRGRPLHTDLLRPGRLGFSERQMAWVYLVAAGILEIVWAFAMKQSHGFTRLAPTVVMIFAMAGGFGLLSLSMRVLPLGLAYSIWTGIGAVGAFVVGVAVLGETITAMRLVAALLIGAGLALMALSIDG